MCMGFVLASYVFWISCIVQVNNNQATQDLFKGFIQLLIVGIGRIHLDYGMTGSGL